VFESPAGEAAAEAIAASIIANMREPNKGSD